MTLNELKGLSKIKEKGKNTGHLHYSVSGNLLKGHVNITT